MCEDNRNPTTDPTRRQSAFSDEGWSSPSESHSLIKEQLVLVTLMIVSVALFALYHWVLGNYELGTQLFVFSGVALISYAFALIFRNTISLCCLGLVGIVLSIFAFNVLGVYATYWCYPLALFVMFLQDRLVARALMALMAALVIPAALFFVPFDLAIRFILSFSMICLFGDLLMASHTKLRSRLEQLAMCDSLTGLRNRRKFIESLTQVCAQDDLGVGACLLVIDIDHFKRVNDTQGHSEGDLVLLAVAQCMRAKAPLGDQVFRIGGEEFAMVLKNTQLACAITYAEALRVKVMETPQASGAVTVSIGVAQCALGCDPDAWFLEADAQLYRAKEAGRNCVMPRLSTQL